MNNNSRIKIKIKTSYYSQIKLYRDSQLQLIQLILLIISSSLSLLLFNAQKLMYSYDYPPLTVIA